MLSKEEKKAIEMLDKFITEHKLFNIKQSDGLEKNIDIVINLIEKLKKENEEKNKIIKLFEHECRKFKAFCRRVRKDGHDIDLFNQGQEHKCNQFLNLINGESHWDYEGKYFDETDKEIKKLSKENE